LVCCSNLKKHGNNCLVPKTHAEGDQNLGAWLQTQRKLTKKGKLLYEGQQKFEEIGVAWDCLEE